MMRTKKNQAAYMSHKVSSSEVSDALNSAKLSSVAASSDIVLSPKLPNSEVATNRGAVKQDIVLDHSI